MRREFNYGPGIEDFDARLFAALGQVAEGDYLGGRWPAGASVSLSPYGEAGATSDYSRQGHDGGDRVERVIARLEMGQRAFCFSDGMRATASAVECLVRPGDVVLVHQSVYGGSIRYFRRLADWGVKVEFADLVSDGAADRIRAAQPHLVFVESVTNPLLQVPDLPGLMDATKEVGGWMVVDNTLPTSFCCIPLEIARRCEFEAVAVVLSLTKGYTAGQLGGAVVTDSAALQQSLFELRQAEGGNASTYDVPHFYSGLTTMYARMNHLVESTLAVVRRISEMAPRGVTTLHPTLYSGTQGLVAHELLLRGPALVTFACELRDVEYAELRDNFQRRLVRANSFNGNHATFSEAALQSHAGVRDERLLHGAGITRQLLRLSVGTHASPATMANLVAELFRHLV